MGFRGFYGANSAKDDLFRWAALAATTALSKASIAASTSSSIAIGSTSILAKMQSGAFSTNIRLVSSQRVSASYHVAL